MFELNVTLPHPLRDVELIDPRTPIAADVPTASATAQEALNQLVARLSETAQQLQTGYRRQLSDMNKATVILATAIAEKLLHQKLARGEFPVEALVRSVTEQLE